MHDVDIQRLTGSRETSFEPFERASFDGRVGSSVRRLTDAQLALAASAALFALGAWPVMTVAIPPLQDLPNHLSTIAILEHPEQYPEFVFNGFLKTNAALFTWLYGVGRLVGSVAAARLFLLMVLAANALVFPRFVLELATGSLRERRGKMLVATLFAVPMIHNWFVSMGMLDFALGIPLSMLLLVLLHRQKMAAPDAPMVPTLLRGVAIAVTALLTWYAHVFALIVVHLLVVLDLLVPNGARAALVEVRGAPLSTWLRARWRETVKVGVPLLPTTLLALWSIFRHVTEPTGAMSGYVSVRTLLPAWELVYNLWAEWMYGFTWLSLSTLVMAVVLAGYAWKNRHDRPAFFSPLAFSVLLVMYTFAPYIATNWFHVNSRFTPYLWLAALLRVPARLPRRFAVGLGLCGLLYSGAMGIDYVRLDRDRARFTAGMAAVPEGARLLPLLFRRQETSENTRSLQHAWGFYVMEKHTSAPLLFAHSRSFPLTYSSPPPVRFNHLVLESFAPNMTSASWMCDQLRNGGVVVDDCQAEYQTRWTEFWREATPLYDHVLTWDASPEALAQMPPEYRPTFREDKLIIWERTSAPAEVSEGFAPRASRAAAPVAVSALR
jgi:hypothetical protein